MASKVVLGERPGNFKPVAVEFVMPDGRDGAIQATYKYRTKPEFGALIDSLKSDKKASDSAASAPIVAVPAPVAEFSWEAFYAQGTDANADYLLDILTAWDLDVPLTRAALIQLDAELPGAVKALVQRYRDIVIDGHLGN